jgi:hypothetical protein
MLRLTRAVFALALVVAVPAVGLAAGQAATGQVPAQSKARFVDTVRGPADLQYLKPVIKRDKDTVVTTFEVKNVSAKAIARLTIEEFWYDASGNPVTGDKQFVKKPLGPGEVATIVLRTPVNAKMNRNSFKFSHANGDVKPKVVPKF